MNIGGTTTVMETWTTSGVAVIQKGTVISNTGRAIRKGPACDR